jgi:hypothetical protein
MKKIIILIYIIISVIIWLKYIEYENYINEPYITVFVEWGLNNKLQTLLSYLYKANQEGKKLKVIWIINYECPDTFENLFKPIPNVEFIYMDKIDYDYKTGYKYNDDFIQETYYKLLQPIDSIQQEIDNTKKLLNYEYIACHLRRTDGWNHNTYIKDRHTDEEYMDFIDQYPQELKIYIATDCRDTQKKFIDKYGDRLIYKKIEDNDNLRQTSLQDAVKDMYVCADAKYFMRSPGTFSNAILHLRNLSK